MCRCLDLGSVSLLVYPGMDAPKGLPFLNVLRQMDIITFLDQARMGMQGGIYVGFVVLYARS